jgi:multisubunit Na+/H+ antiporter MnhB subunit
MSKKVFWIVLTISLLVNAILHIQLLSHGNFYFTVDQGKDAMFVREINERSQIIFRGPVTSVAGVHAGPLWFYFIAIGYRIFNGNPYGAPFMELLLNSGGVLFAALFLEKKIGRNRTLIAIIPLLFSWQFFETAAWGFNPFPLTILALVQALLLSEFLNNKSRYYFWALVPTMLAFHAEVAGATTMFLFYVVIGAVGVRQKYISFKKYSLYSFIIPILLVAPLSYELLKRAQFANQVYTGHSTGLGIFAKTTFGPMSRNLGEIVGSAIIRQQWPVGLFAMLIVLGTYLKKRKHDFNFESRLTFLVAIMVGIAYMFFGSNNGWRDWQTVYFYPLLFLLFMILATSLKSKIIWIVVIAVLCFKIPTFITRYNTYPSPKDDVSILANEMKVIDWIYTHSENDGFNVYTYTDGFFDYTYQYLFWWYGRDKYGFVPCEYANYPHSPKENYVPGYLSYSEPRLGCTKFRFLILESDTNGESNEGWLEDFQKSTTLVESHSVGKIVIEKRRVN